jgi:methylthioribose-1-phosphate isomerase
MFYNPFTNQVFIEAAETMLVDDVADNKAIGSHGAKFLQLQLGSSKNISVLTHCNTGRYTCKPILKFSYKMLKFLILL